MKILTKPANFDAKLQHSIELLQKSEALALRYYDKGFYLAFSGGKDSQALYHVTELAGVKFEEESTTYYANAVLLCSSERNKGSGNGNAYRCTPCGIRAT